MSDSKVINLTGEAEFTKEALKSDLPVLVDFWAPWCGPCRMMAPILDQLSLAMDGKLKVAKVDTENGQNQGLAMQYDIQSIPNMKLLKGGKVIGEFIGMRDLGTIQSEVSKLIG